MYPISQAFEEAVKSPTQKYNISGTVGGVSFTDANILAGSLSITNQCADNAEIVLGSVYIGELTATFINLGISTYDWYDSDIIIYFAPENAESIPMGIYTISEAQHTASGVVVKAYDYMAKFDVAWTESQYQAEPYDILNYACDACNVTLGMTRTQIEAMPNGDRVWTVSEDFNATTWRDFLSWVALTLGGFATINRVGALEIRLYTQTVVDTLDSTLRYTGASFSDFVTRYTGLSYVDINTQTTRYISISPDDGLTYNIGTNPFFDKIIDTAKEAMATEILDAMQSIQYVPFSATSTSNPAYDLGDVIRFSGGIADGAKVSCVTKFTFDYNKGYSMVGVGKNPRLATAQSKASKEISGLLSKINEESWYNYYFENLEELKVTGLANLLTAALVLQTLKEAKLTLIYTVHFDSGSMGRFAVFFYINGEIYKTYKHTFLDGENTATIHFTFNVTSAQTNHINIFMISESYSTITIDGTWQDIYPYTWESLSALSWEDLATPGTYSVTPPTLTIPMGYSQVTVFGKGLAATEAWDGTIECNDTVEEISPDDFIGGIVGVTLVNKISVDGVEVSDELNGIAVLGMLDTLTDSVTLEDNILYYSPYIQADDVTLTDITTNGGTWYGAGEIEDDDAATIVIDSEFYTADLTEISATDSGGYWQVSFDGGSTWVGYSGGTWSSDTYMTTASMRTVTNAEYIAEGDTIKVMAYVEDGCTVSGIKVKGGAVV